MHENYISLVSYKYQKWIQNFGATENECASKTVTKTSNDFVYQTSNFKICPTSANQLFPFWKFQTFLVKYTACFWNIGILLFCATLKLFLNPNGPPSEHIL